MDSFFGSLKFRNFGFKFQLMFSCFTVYLNQFKLFAANHVISSVITQAFSRLSDLILAESKLYEIFQKNCLESLLYPLLFGSLKSSLFSLSSLSSMNLSKETSVLKSFSY
jgi:hypothetical protein